MNAQSFQQRKARRADGAARQGEGGDPGIQLASVVSTLSTFLDRPDGDDFDEDFELQFAAVSRKAEQLLDGIAKPKLGRGGGGPGVRAPKLQMPSQMYYDSYVRLPEQFQGLCGYSPKEFEDLHTDVLDVLQRTRNQNQTFTEEENKLRRKRRYKFSSRERLWHFLMFNRCYPRLRKNGADIGMSKSAFLLDFVCKDGYGDFEKLQPCKSDYTTSQNTYQTCPKRPR